MKTQPNQSRRGASLIESLIVTAVAAVLVGAAAPGFQESRARRHVEGAAAQLETDIQFTRSLAVARNHNLRVEFASGGEGSCYVVHTGAAGDCRCAAQGPVCTGGAEALRHVHYGPGATFEIKANVRSMVFDAEKGTVTPTATVRLEGQRGHTLHQVVNILGRMRTCTPNSTLAGYRAC
jgi:type IV fimbrial biogenesis protein FimT